MSAVTSRKRPGFTLVELLTVIAIIVLLIGILIPALSSARTQAKQTATSGLIKSVGSGCEMFRGDFKHYPQSRGRNPFENASDDISLMGAQWVALQLAGVDSRGYVNPTIKNDSDDNGRIDHVDWNDWYALNPSRQYTRMGPYASVDAKALRTPIQFRDENPDIPPPDAMADEAEDWSNGRLPFFMDAFGYPVLYYRANPKTTAPFTTGTPTGGDDFVVGQYDQADNAFFTGSDGTDGRWPCVANAVGDWWDLSGSGEPHPLGTLGYDEGDTDWPEARSFAAFVCDANIYDATDKGSGGRVWPHKADSYLLISAGPDALYGTGDDVTNFGVGGQSN
jgi:prepilin-type N-terminal cleavage/methylation domain-containing protein